MKKDFKLGFFLDFSFLIVIFILITLFSYLAAPHLEDIQYKSEILPESVNTSEESVFVASVLGSMQQSFDKLKSFIVGFLILVFLVYCFFKSYAWRVSFGNKFDKNYFLKFLWLSLIWFSMFLAVYFLTKFNTALSLIVFVVLFSLFYTNYVILNKYNLKESFKVLFKNLNKLHLIILNFLIILLLYLVCFYLLTYLAVLNDVLFFLLFIIGISFVTTFNRNFFTSKIKKLI